MIEAKFSYELMQRLLDMLCNHAVLEDYRWYALQPGNKLYKSETFVAKPDQDKLLGHTYYVHYYTDVITVMNVGSDIDYICELLEDEL